jgi:DNA polymerase
VRPKIIVCLGRIAAKAVIDANIRITRDRGKWYNKKGIKMIATFHPSALLHDVSKKKDAWEDFKSIRDALAEIKKEEQETKKEEI